MYDTLTKRFNNIAAIRPSKTAITYKNGDKYEGKFKNDKSEGQGTYTLANGKKYMGEFKDGQRVEKK